MVMFTQEPINVIKDILLEFGPHKINDIYKYFQRNKEEDAKKIANNIIRTLSRSRTITIKEDIIKVNCPQEYDDRTNSVSFQKSLILLQYLFQLRNKEGKFIYWKKIEYAMSLNRYPDTLIVSIDHKLIYFQYCESDDIANYNMLVNEIDNRDGFTNENINRILISDEYIEPDEVNVNGIINIVAIDSENNVHIVR